MTETGHIATPPPRARLAVFTLGAVAAATLIVFGAILPAEFGQDPLGLGRLAGLDRLWAPPEVAFVPADGEDIGTLARAYAAPLRQDTVEIPLQGIFGPLFANEIEYKVRMPKDATLVYSWTVEPEILPDELYYDFHSHTLEDREAMTVASHGDDTATAANGALVAPFDGVHGWYFQNQSGDQVVIRLQLSGFYELIPPGETGNVGGILANVPAAEAVTSQ